MGEEAQTSPKKKLKILCSHGGKILPRPSDGQLKYVGGETRVVAVPRTITFPELKKRLNSLAVGDMLLKYQMMPEDLDVLVSVKSDEDLRHMIDEYDRQGGDGGGSPRFRAFLFPTTPFRISSNHHSSIIHSNSDDSNSMEQQYIDAINGIVRATRNGSTGRPMMGTVSSASSLPRSLAPGTSAAAETMNQESALYEGSCNPSRPLDGGGIRRSSHVQNMHKVHSSPSLFSLGQHQSQQLHHHHHQQQQQYSNEVIVQPRIPVSPRICASEGGKQHSRYYYQACQQKATGDCFGCCRHADGWTGPCRSGGFGDPENSIPQLCMKQMPVEGSMWNHGLDYRDR